MNSFELFNPTKLIFGQDSFEKIKVELTNYDHILFCYGGGSIKENGIYHTIIDALESKHYIEFGGIEPNPTYETLQKAVKIIKENNIKFILAVGGGSVIDGVKYLAAASIYQGDGWDILSKGIRITEALPFGTVLTLPATGSEMNSGAVISIKALGQKMPMGGPALFPKFSISNPNVIKTLPKNQLRNGVVDAFVHVLEQYMTYPHSGILQDRLAESILKTLIEIAPKLLHDPYDETIASNFMWCCTMALNGLIAKGVPTDWSIHAIGHELTSMYHIDHAMTLAIILPSMYNYKFENKKEKLAQYGARIWNINEISTDDTAHQAIDETIRFFHSIGVKTTLSEYTSDTNQCAESIQAVFEKKGISGLGERKDILPSDIYQIVLNSY